ncbi:MAG: ATP-binding cassette domain-containing protein [Myxococcota bacterium]|nr:ATP-binding cassette domain-containing protein [Myxococcota bacterium]
MAAPICIENLHKGFGDHQVLKGVDLQLEPQEILYVLGPSGTGKSVLSQCALGFLAPDQGQIWLSGERIPALGDPAWLALRRRTALVVQTPALLEERTVHENVALAARHALGMSTRDADQRATSLLSDLNLRHLSKQRAAGLGPGIAKAVALARALAVGAQTLILDEPTTGLDPIQAMVVDEAITDAVRSEGVSALVISHDLESMKKVADRAILLYDGGIRVRGTPSELLNHEDEIWQQFQAGRAEGPL